jgi:hypothetical protein
MSSKVCNARKSAQVARWVFPIQEVVNFEHVMDNQRAKEGEVN